MFESEIFFGTQNAHLLNLSQELSEYAVIPANQTSSFADDPENNADFESHILFDESTARADSEDYFLSDDYSMLSDGAHAHGSQTDAFVGSDNNFAVQNDAERNNDLTSLVFVFDTTGSMHDDLARVKEGTTRILATILAHPSRLIGNYVLVPFNDPVVGPPTVTVDPAVFKERLYVTSILDGGGDCPEMSVGGIKMGLENSLPGAYIYVFTDASAKDFHLLPHVLAMVQQKRSQIVFVLTGDCGDDAHVGYQVYEKIAATSSGQVFHLNKTDVEEVLNFVESSLKLKKVNLLSVNKPLPATEKHNIYIDESVKEFTVSVSGRKPKIEVVDPQGHDIEGPPKLEPVLNLENVKVISVKEPDPGKWKVTTSSESKHTVRSTGLSEINFNYGFSIAHVNKMTETSHRPLKGVKNTILIELTNIENELDLENVKLLDMKGNAIHVIPLTVVSGSKNMYQGEMFLPPPDYFYIEINGKDKNGYEIRRIAPTAINSQMPGLPTIYMPTHISSIINKPVIFRCRIESLVPFEMIWMKDGKPLERKRKYDKTTEVVWKLFNATETSEGDYVCWARNDAGSTKQHTKLSVAGPPPIVKTSKVVFASEGGDVTIDCSVLSELKYTQSWARFDENITELFTGPAHVDPLKSNSRIEILRNGSLVIKNIELEDNGYYVCTGQNKGGMSFGKVLLKITQPVELILKPIEVEFKSGESLQFECHVTGTTEPQLIWKKNGNVLTEVDSAVKIIYFNSSSLLTIYNSNIHDEGIYECETYETDGVSGKSIAVYVEDPTATIRELNITVKEGELVVIKCDVTGVPFPAVTWYRVIHGNEVVLPNVDLEHSREHKLEIFNFGSSKSGKYICKAVNKLGKAEAYTYIDTAIHPTIIYISPDTNIDINTDGMLRCAASGKPTPVISWYKSGDFKISGVLSEMNGSNLTITKAQLNDEGTYLCVAENIAGKVQAETLIKITGIAAPIIQQQDLFIDAISNETITLSCEVEAKPPAFIQWLKDGNLIENHNNIKYLDDNARLQITTNINDSGLYECIATNDLGSAHKYVEVSVLKPPVFLSNTFEEHTVMIGTNFILNCAADGFPKPFIVWKKDEMPINFKSEELIKEGQVNILNIQTQNSGTYKCTAVNSAGNASKTIVLEAQAAPKIRKEDLQISTTRGEIVTLNCEADAYPPAVITWFKDGRPIDIHKNAIIYSDKNSKIQFVADSYDDGTYECIATNVVGVDHKNIEVSVLKSPVFQTTDYEEHKVNINKNFILKCDVEGFPSPLITWKKDGLPIPLSPYVSLYQDGSGLNILNIQPDDSGIYECSAINSVGKARKTIVLHVEAAPQIHEQEVFINSMLGEIITLTCEVEAHPPATITWFKDGKPLELHKKNIIFLDNNSRVKFVVDSYDAGKYECLASNVVASAKKLIHVSIMFPPKVSTPTSTSEKIFKAVHGEDVILRCDIEASPTPQIQWMKNGNDITNDSNFSFTDDKELVIRQVSWDSGGIYMCDAENEAGITQRLFYVIVQEPPRIIDLQSMKVELMEGEAFSMSCKAYGSPTPNISWKLIVENKDGITITDDNTITISAALKENSGLYTCFAENSEGTDEKNILIEVMVPPALVDTAKSRLELNEGETLLITCPIVNAVPPPQIQWLKDGYLIDFSSKHHSNNILAQDYGRSLKLLHASQNDKGIYSCVAVNLAGHTTATFVVDIFTLPQIQFFSPNQETEVKTLSQVTLECSVTGYPKPQIIWQKDGYTITPQSTPAVEMSRNRHYLIIHRANVEDSGVYKCLAVNKLGRRERDFKIRVIDPPDIEGPLHENYELVKGDSAILQCSFTGYPKPQITWIKDGGDASFLQKDNVIVSEDSTVLEISEANLINQGTYTCIGINNAGRKEKHFTITITVPPTKLDGLDEIKFKVKTHTDLPLFCNVSGVPPPQIIWVNANVANVSHNQPYVKLHENNKTLILKNITSDHMGRYSCLAFNTAGATKLSFDVEVQEAPSGFLVQDVYNHTVKMHDQLTLRCNLDGYPVPNISWFKENQTISVTKRNIQISHDGRQLYIIYALEEDSGRYSCLARNDAGFKELVFNVKVEEPIGWSSWSTWSACSASCGNGEQVRKRLCGGSHFTHHTGSLECFGHNEEWKNCDLPECQVDGQWSLWSEWTPCSKTCGRASRQRFRKCNNPPPSHGGQNCVGPSEQIEYCYEGQCPVHGQWSDWSEWGSCSVSCDSGIRIRKRLCNKPVPAFGGNDCLGMAVSVSACYMPKCPENGQWSSWSKWSSCSVSCGLGNRQRHRSCSNPTPKYGGQYCSGENVQISKCVTKSCKNVPQHAALSVKGHLNGERISNYVVDATITDNGGKRTIEASAHDILKHQSGWFPYLKFILSPVSWNAAYEEDEANNGYSLTNGNFKQHSEIEFFTGEQLVVRHTGKGTSDDGKLKVEIEVDGEVPLVEPQATVQIQPYEEDYVQTGPNSLYSFSSNSLNINGVNNHYSMNNTVHYDNLRGKMPYLVERLTTRDIESEYNPRSQEMKYIMSTSIAKKYNNDMCPEGFIHDDRHMHCRDIDECSDKLMNKCHPSQICENLFGSYRCYCRKGYHSMGMGKKCLDINECMADPTICSHLCKNIRGSFKCICPTGYILLDDKKSCSDINECNILPSKCTSEQTCLNMNGGYKCLDTPCPEGYERDQHTKNCVIYCIGNNLCDEGAALTQTISYLVETIESNTIQQYRSLINISVNDNNGLSIPHTYYKIVENEAGKLFRIRSEKGHAVLYPLTNLQQGIIHSISILATSYDRKEETLLHTTKFIISIYVPYDD